MKFLFVLLSLSLIPVFLFAQEIKVAPGPITIEADTISYEAETATFRAEGKVLISFPEGTLSANEVIFERGKNLAHARGNVLIKTETDLLEGEKIDFDLVANRGVVTTGKIFISRSHFYLKGNRIEKTGVASYYMEEVCLTTCEGEKPDWSITGRELKVTFDGYGTVKDGRFLVKDIPILYIPYFIFPAKTTRQSGLLFPRFAYSREKLGYDVEIPLFVALSKSTDATFYQRYMEKRGFMEGVEFRYYLGENSFGTIYSDYLRDKFKTEEQAGGLYRNWQDPRGRWSFYLHNETNLSPTTFLRADVMQVSDEWYFKDFSAHNYYLDHYSEKPEERFKKISFRADESLDRLESKVRLSKDFPLYNVTALIHHSRDLTEPANAATLQKYPQVTLSGMKQPLFDSPLNFAINATAGENYRKEGMKGKVIEINPLIFLPLNLGDPIRFIPEVAATATYWKRDDITEEGLRKALRLGTKFTTSLFRDYNLSGPEGNKIRHEIRPEVAYNYVTSTHEETMPDFVTPLPEENLLSFGLINSLVSGRKGRYREIARLKIAEAFDLKELRKETEPPETRRPFGNILFDLDFTPEDYLQFSARLRFDPNSGQLIKNDHDLNLKDKKGNSLNLGYRYTKDILEEINFSLKVYATKAVNVSYELKRNELDKKSLRHIAGINYQHQCWSFGISYADDATDRAILFNISLSGLSNR